MSAHRLDKLSEAIREALGRTWVVALTPACASAAQQKRLIAVEKNLLAAFERVTELRNAPDDEPEAA